MRIHLIHTIALACLVSGAAWHKADAAVYDFSFSLVYPIGEGAYAFQGMFDSSVPDSGSGTFSYTPIAAANSPYQLQLTGLNTVLSFETTNLGTLAEVTITNFPQNSDPFYNNIGVFPVYFIESGDSFVYDLADNSAYGTGGSLVLVSGPSTVPLPGAAAMFGAALVSLGLIGRGLQPRREVPAA